MDYTNLPLGFALSLAMNEQAMNHYAGLTEYEKEKIIAESRNVKSKSDMEKLINRLGEGRMQ